MAKCTFINGQLAIWSGIVRLFNSSLLPDAFASTKLFQRFFLLITDNFHSFSSPALQPSPDAVEENRERTVSGDVAGGNNRVK